MREVLHADESRVGGTTWEGDVILRVLAGKTESIFCLRSSFTNARPCDDVWPAVVV